MTPVKNMNQLPLKFHDRFKFIALNWLIYILQQVIDLDDSNDSDVIEIKPPTPPLITIDDDNEDFSPQSPSAPSTSNGNIFQRILVFVYAFYKLPFKRILFISIIIIFIIF